MQYIAAKFEAGRGHDLQAPYPSTVYEAEIKSKNVSSWYKLYWEDACVIAIDSPPCWPGPGGAGVCDAPLPFLPPPLPGAPERPCLAPICFRRVPESAFLHRGCAYANACVCPARTGHKRIVSASPEMRVWRCRRRSTSSSRATSLTSAGTLSASEIKANLLAPQYKLYQHH
eukprot:1895604-Rhodomonas_salina.4